MKVVVARKTDMRSDQSSGLVAVFDNHPSPGLGLGDVLRLANATVVAPESANLAILRADPLGDVHAQIRAVRHVVPAAVLLVVGPNSIQASALLAGATHFLTEPIDMEALRQYVSSPKPSDLKVVPPRKSDMLIGNSEAMQQTLGRITIAARSGIHTLIIGDSGTGKELAARAIHYTSARKAGPFVAVNCGAISEGLVESELFGHRRGAFTGADRDRRGFFAAANGGTLFLDEIGNAPPHLQVKLLRVLELGEVMPVGSDQTIHVDVRVVAATNVDLRTQVENGSFREDLYYRLTGVEVRMPLLRDRVEDIAELATHHVRLIAQRQGWVPPRITPQALKRLEQYDWPGNVRQLVHALSRAVACHSNGRIEAEDIVLESPRMRPLVDAQALVTYREAKLKFEQDYLTRLLTHTKGNVAEAARIAGRERKDFYELCVRAGLDVAKFR